MMPMIVSWNLTRRCNLTCGHCYLDAVQRKRETPDELNTEEACGVIEQIAELAPGAMLVMTGGEPLIRRDLPVLVEAAAKLGLMPVIGTNGTLLSLFRAVELKRAGAVGVGISVDSATSAFHDRLRGQVGAWAAAIAGIEAARQTGLGVLLQATLFEENRGELADLADLAESAGAMALNFFFLVCTGRGVTQTDLSSAAYEEALQEILRLQQARPKLMIRARCAPYARRLQGLHAGVSDGAYADWSSACLAGRRYLRITPSGGVTPCPYIPQVVGNLRESALKQVWEEHPLFRRLRTELPGGKCGDCDFRFSCGGCRARALAMHGDLMAEDPKCGYCRPAEAVPEPLAAGGRTQGSAPSWTPEARALLERIPGFVRERVRANLEREAEKVRVECIDLEFMRAHRPSALPFGRP
ncbi:MAG: radical SAM protein [Betaproteobacteria bacterium]|nr:radical SAM protein [Betaproteobacteria bacterium]